MRDLTEVELEQVSGGHVTPPPIHGGHQPPTDGGLPPPTDGGHPPPTPGGRQTHGGHQPG